MNPLYYKNQIQEMVLANPAATATEKALGQLVVELAREVDLLSRRERENSEQIREWKKRSR